SGADSRILEQGRRPAANRQRPSLPVVRRQAVSQGGHALAELFFGRLDVHHGFYCNIIPFVPPLVCPGRPFFSLPAGIVMMGTEENTTGRIRISCCCCKRIGSANRSGQFPF